MEIIIYLVVAFVLLDLIFIGFVLYMRKKKKLSERDKAYFIDQWQKIKTDKDYVHAVMGADKLLDWLLAKRGYSGSLGQKLKAANNLFTDINGVWSAHKLRNKLAHELDANISYKEAKRALNNFEKAFKDLGLL